MSYRSLDSRARAAAFRTSWDLQRPLGLPRENARACDRAHADANRALQGLDDATVAAALHAAEQFRAVGVPDHVVNKLADGVHATCCRILIEECKL